MDNVFFIVSKLAWGLLSLSNIIILMTTLATLFLVKGKARSAQWCLMPIVLLVGSLMLYPWGEWVMHPLETRFERPEIMPEQIDGIIVLGGGEKLKVSISWQTAQISEAGDRYIAAANLAKQYPKAPVFFTGGSGLLNFQTEGVGAGISQTLLTSVGVESNRLWIEPKARNTYENVQLIKPLLPKKTGKYLLVTSAFHMPRSVGIARTQDVNVIPYPTDYRSTYPEHRQWSMNLLGNLTLLETAWREWIGLTVYYFTGKTSSWFPGREKENHE